MPKKLKTIIEEQRELAKRNLEWHRTSSDMTALAPAMNLPTALVLRYLGDPDQLERLAAMDVATLPALATAIPSIVEHEVVDSVWHSKGDFVWSIAFSALHEVDWDELAMEFEHRLRERSELLETAKRSGFLTLIQADDLPKN